jgi:hypothetical protein
MTMYSMTYIDVKELANMAICPTLLNNTCSRDQKLGPQFALSYMPTIPSTLHRLELSIRLGL